MALLLHPEAFFFCYLQYSSIRCTKVTQRVISISGDEDGSEKDASHLPVEEVQSVERLRHQSGFVTACVITHITLHKQEKHTQVKGC